MSSYLVILVNKKGEPFKRKIVLARNERAALSKAAHRERGLKPFWAELIQLFENV